MNDCNTILDSILPFLLVISFICGFLFFRRLNAKKGGQQIQNKIHFKKTPRYALNEEDKTFFVK